MGMVSSKTLAERFWYRVDKRSSDECWLWIGGHNGRYGILSRGPRGAGMVYAHRCSYELAKGSIPDGLLVLHKCDTPKCVNPGHLFLGTQIKNMADMVSKGRQSKIARTPGEKNRHAKLTDDNVRAIRILISHGMRTSQLAECFELSRHAITKIKTGRSWKHLK